MFKSDAGSGGSTPAGPTAPGGGDLTDAQKAFLAAMQGQQSASNSESLFWGRAYNGSQLQENFKTLSEAYAEFWANADVRNRWLDETNRMGLTRPGEVDKAFSLWVDSIKTSNALLQAGKKMSPWDILDIRGGASDGVVGGAPKTTTSTSKSVRHLSPGDIDVATKSVFQDQLGRDPTAAELARYRGIALREESRNPAITTTTTTTDPNGNTTSSSNTSGGLDGAGLQNVMLNNVSDDPEHGALQAATYYFNALHDAIGPGA